MLFKNNRHRALIDKDSDDEQLLSDVNMMEDQLPNLNIKSEKLRSTKKNQLASALLGYPVRTDLDRKLIQGIFS